MVDTDILIDVAVGFEAAKVHLSDLEQNFRLAVSAITYMELVVGYRNKRELKLLETFLRTFVTVPLHEAASETATALLKRYRLSHGLLIPDALIAATAVTSGASLSSKNQRDYRFIGELELLPYPS